jgi:IS30 family transposase
MDIIQGITISEMAKELNAPRHTIETRLIRAGIKPITYEALYPSDTLEKIKNAKRGRPPKSPKPD